MIGAAGLSTEPAEARSDAAPAEDTPDTPSDRDRDDPVGASVYPPSDSEEGGAVPEPAVGRDSSEPLPSAWALRPTERGGEEARRGFHVQDHVAAGFYLAMASQDAPEAPEAEGAADSAHLRLARVWCEADDDILLIWVPVGTSEGGTAPGAAQADAAARLPTALAATSDSPGDAVVPGAEVEFVQVKTNERDQLWSAALLCERKAGTSGRAVPGSSIIERSLSRDRYAEPSRFRVVTTRAVNGDLRHLELPLSHEHRHPEAPAQGRLGALLKAHVKRARSPKGNDWTYWLARARWDVRHAEDAVRNANLLHLDRVLRALGGFPAPDQRGVIYERLVRRAYEAALADRVRAPRQKRMDRDEIVGLLRRAAVEAETAGAADGVSALDRKLAVAGLSSVTVRTAREARHRYLLERRRRLSRRYYSLEDRARYARLEDEVAESLHSLWALLEAGAIVEDPSAFYARCLAEVDAVWEGWDRPLGAPRSPRLAGPAGDAPRVDGRGVRSGEPIAGTVLSDRPSRTHARGMMFELVNRCVHRFDHASL